MILLCHPSAHSDNKTVEVGRTGSLETEHTISNRINLFFPHLSRSKRREGGLEKESAQVGGICSDYWLPVLTDRRKYAYYTDGCHSHTWTTLFIKHYMRDGGSTAVFTLPVSAAGTHAIVLKLTLTAGSKKAIRV